MKKILLLGATGTMGVFLVDIFKKNSNYKVYVTSRSLHSNTDKIVYLLGNARDDSFMAELLEKNHYDAIVDFMNYGYQEFQDYHKRLLAACDHYIFLSSCRVFAESQFRLQKILRDCWMFQQIKNFSLRKDML